MQKLTPRVAAEIGGVWIAVLLIDRLYAITGATWFESWPFWTRPLPLILPLIPFLVLVVGPTSKSLYDKLTKGEPKYQDVAYIGRNGYVKPRKTDSLSQAS